MHVCLVLCLAVGLQMKLEFFQRKFWTACRQVTNKNICLQLICIKWLSVKLIHLCFVLSVQLWMENAALAVTARYEKSHNSDSSIIYFCSCLLTFKYTSHLYLPWGAIYCTAAAEKKHTFFNRQIAKGNTNRRTLNWVICSSYSPFWQDINCYLIDNNGFILVTEEQSQVLCEHMFTWSLNKSRSW